MLRRLSPEQPDHFEFTAANREWAEAQMTKFPEGRQASAVIPLLWRAQEQEGWLSRPAIETVAEMLGMAYIRVLEVATFYFMFQLHPVGQVANIQVCGTTTCMICGSGDLIRVCREKIAPTPHTVSADGKFSWEEVECLGACTNAPMVQIGKDFYEDLTAEKLSSLIDAIGAGQVPVPGPQNGRFSSEPVTGLTALTEVRSDDVELNASAARAVELHDTVRRIDGMEVPILTKWQRSPDQETPPNENDPKVQEEAERASDRAGEKGADEAATADEDRIKGEGERENEHFGSGPALTTDSQRARRPESLDNPREDSPTDDLKRINGVDAEVEKKLNGMGIWHFDQIAGWGPEELAWVDQNLEGFSGRASKDDWVGQAGKLGETEISPSDAKDDKTST
ncbi:NADH-quinone oxidoreductase subunit E [Paracoccus sp. TK19116]|uniref:NADH-quinone oxidoreductase subunit E n=1 Tax=Paracoccus albicereus TaxID=2922394 RepID=A0ABT1MSD8_9RHOB|nr:NADH-quinone oxidoreductase subunit E [Paracoccus albicereus]MCQ0969796.1 NADH-quinone oxidoreductase subunit E [Paracoccus albicereus]